MTEVASTLTGFLLGLLGSWVFWRYLLYLRPEVRISECVLKGTHLLNEHETVYRIKIYNDGSRQVIDLQVDVSIWELRKDRWVFVRKVQLSQEGALPVLGTRRDARDPLKALSPGFTFLIHGETSLEKDLGDVRKLRMTLSSRDAISGTAVVQRVVYGSNNIQVGEFERGSSLERKTN